MRTIDADALRDKLQSLAYDDWNQGVITSWADAYNECADIVNDMPTIEPQRIRGRWKTFGWNGVYCECSECGNTCSYQFNFCPNCGADMRETE